MSISKKYLEKRDSKFQEYCLSLSLINGHDASLETHDGWILCNSCDNYMFHKKTISIDGYLLISCGAKIQADGYIAPLEVWEKFRQYVFENWGVDIELT